MTTIVVVDDHPLFRDGLIALLETVPGMDVVGSVGSGVEAVQTVEALTPDVVLRGRQIVRQAHALVERQDLVDVVRVGFAAGQPVSEDLEHVSDAIRSKMVKNALKYPAAEFRGRYSREQKGRSQHD